MAMKPGKKLKENRIECTVVNSVINSLVGSVINNIVRNEG